MVVGILTYFLSIFAVALQNKFKAMEIVRGMMSSSPEECTVKAGGREQRITDQSRLGPRTRPRGEPANFAALPADGDGCKRFMEGLYKWGVVHMWDYAETKNLANTCEIKHGVPFLGLARLGYMSAPTPKDLCGVLNANALDIPALHWRVHPLKQAHGGVDALDPAAARRMPFLLFPSLATQTRSLKP